jgi:hypothetical protein
LRSGDLDDVTNTTHHTEQDTMRSDRAPVAERSTAHPDRTPPPSSPEPDHDALAQGIEKLESVKAY